MPLHEYLLTGNARQNEAIRHSKGPCLVLAPPGSGKTFVIVQRIRYLTKLLHIPPDQIVSVTFSKAAAMQMQQRFMKETDHATCGVTFGTFHSLYFQILKEGTRNTAPLQLISEEEKRMFLLQAVEEVQCRHMQSVSFSQIEPLSEEEVRYLLAEIAKQQNRPAQDMIQSVPTQTPLDQDDTSHTICPFFDEIADAYRTWKRRKGKLDFDDMILQCEELLKKRPDYLKQLQRRYRYFLIDEFQDISPAQYRVLMLLAGEDCNVFAVGDDDQSIYSFRAASPALMHLFAKQRKDTKINYLQVNYRCREAIIQSAGRLIRHNTGRFQKKMKAGRTDSKGALHLHAYPSLYTETDAVIKKAITVTSAGRSVAILLRTNAEAGRYRKRLEAQGIFVDRPKDTALSDAPLAQDICHYLNFALRGRKRSDFFRIMNKPERMFLRDAVQKESVTTSSLLRFYESRPLMRERILRFEEDMARIQTMPPSLSVRYLLDVVGLRGLYPAEDETAERILFAASASCDYDAFLQKLKQKTTTRNKMTPLIRVMTLHASKGLEFDTVFLPHLNEGNLPAGFSLNRETLAEERRLFYVGITRARFEVFFSYIKEGGAAGERPSLFLNNLRQSFEGRVTNVL